MEHDGLDFFSSPREAAETRMRSLARKASVRKARAKAELQFRSEEVAANWRNWKERLGEASEFYSPSLPSRCRSIRQDPRRGDLE
jgi:hypothetical protein